MKNILKRFALSWLLFLSGQGCMVYGYDSGFTNSYSVSPNGLNKLSEKYGCGVVGSSSIMAVVEAYDCRLNYVVGTVHLYAKNGVNFDYKVTQALDENIISTSKRVEDLVSVYEAAIAIGDPSSSPNGIAGEGGIKVYRWSGTDFSLETVSLPVEYRQANAYLGASVSLFGDVIVAGAPGWDLLNDGAGNRYNSVGRVYIWRRGILGNWAFEKVIDNPVTPKSKSQYTHFGRSVRGVSNSVVVAAESETGYESWNDLNNKIVYVYDYLNGGWTSTPTSTLDYSGYSSGISSIDYRGAHLALGWSGRNRVSIFKRTGGVGAAFDLFSSLQPFDKDESKAFGASVSLGSNRVVVGAPYDTRGSNQSAGAVYVYELTDTAVIPEIKVMSDPVSSYDYLGYSSKLIGNKLFATVPVAHRYNSYNYVDTGRLYSYDLPVKYSLNVSKYGTGSVVSSPSGINCGTVCSASYGANTPVTLTASPEVGYYFSDWSGGNCSGSGGCTVTMDSDKTIVANFVALPNPTLTVSTSGSGVVTSNLGGINCGSNCTWGYSFGNSVTLTATPSVGYRFDGWGGACSGTGTCTLTLNSSQTVRASFSLIPVYYSLNVSSNGLGSVLSDPAGILCPSNSCSATYLSGTNVTLYPTAASGYYFTGWSGACTGLGTCTVSMTGNQSVTANYSAIPSGSTLLSVSKTGKGVVTSSPSGITCGVGCYYPYTNNTLVTLYATADPGNTFGGWTGACTGKSSCMVIMSANQNVAATFKSNYLMILPILNDYLNR